MEASTEAVTLTTHAETDFDPASYINELEQFDENSESGNFVKFILDSLHEIYKTGEITGDRLLDIGAGPVCHIVYAGSKWFKEVVLSDFSDANLRVLRNWKQGKLNYLEPLFKYMMRLEDSSEDWITCSRRLADKVTSIVHCDLRKPDPLAGTQVEGVKFDAISLSLVQIAASLTTEEYKEALRNYSQLLKPGGHIIVVDLLGQSSYLVGDSLRFRTYKAEKKELQDIYKEFGYEIISWKQLDGPWDPVYVQDSDVSLFAMVARKK